MFLISVQTAKPELSSISRILGFALPTTLPERTSKPLEPLLSTCVSYSSCKQSKSIFLVECKRPSETLMNPSLPSEENDTDALHSAHQIQQQALAYTPPYKVKCFSNEGTFKLNLPPAVIPPSTRPRPQRTEAKIPA